MYYLYHVVIQLQVYYTDHTIMQAGEAEQGGGAIAPPKIIQDAHVQLTNI